jgi:hypothetical protein
MMVCAGCPLILTFSPEGEKETGAGLRTILKYTGAGFLPAAMGN